MFTMGGVPIANQGPGHESVLVTEEEKDRVELLGREAALRARLIRDPPPPLRPFRWALDWRCLRFWWRLRGGTWRVVSVCARLLRQARLVVTAFLCVFGLAGSVEAWSASLPLVRGPRRATSEEDSICVVIGDQDFTIV